MPKWCNDLAADAAIDFIINNCNEMRLCNSGAMVGGVPSYSAIRSTAALTDAIAMTPGEFTKQDSTSGTGRECVVAQQDDVGITASGDSYYVALLDTTNSRALYLMDSYLKNFLSGATTDIPSWSFSFRDPS